MRADMKVPHRTGLRARISNRLRDKVRFWVTGHQIRYFDEGHDLLDWDHPSYPPIKVLEAVPGGEQPIKVGKYTGLHYTATIIPGGQHHLDWVGTLHAHVEGDQWVTQEGSIYASGPVVIGNDVFVAFEALIGSGITIGDGAVVAARAVVVKDVEPYSIVGGNPAKHLRYRFDEPTREALLRIKWWDWSTEKVTAHKAQIHSPDVAAFVAGHDPASGPPSCVLCSPSAGA